MRSEIYEKTKNALLTLFAAVMLCGCSTRTQSAVITSSVSLNTMTADLSGYSYLEDSSPSIQQISLKESLRMFNEGGSGILYYGKTDCRWCQLAVPELNTAAKSMGVTVFYIDVTDAETDDSYEDLKKAIESTFKTNTSGQKAFMIPTVIAVKNGTIVDSHLSLVDDFNPTSDTDRLDYTQSMELQNVYKELIRKAAE